jgi:hypothetical protein
MAAAEARAAWQRAANHCLVQEDRKRAPKLACCPPASEQQHDGNCVKSGDHPISNFMPLSCNPMNSSLPPDIRWWVHLQPKFEIQKDLIRDVCDKKVDDSALNPKPEEPLLCEIFGTNVEKSADLFDPPQMVSASFTKSSSERSLDELRTIDDYSQVPPKGRGAVVVIPLQIPCRHVTSSNQAMTRAPDGATRPDPPPAARRSHRPGRLHHLPPHRHRRALAPCRHGPPSLHQRRHILRFSGTRDRDSGLQLHRKQRPLLS